MNTTLDAAEVLGHITIIPIPTNLLLKGSIEVPYFS